MENELTERQKKLYTFLFLTALLMPAFLGLLWSVLFRDQRADTFIFVDRLLEASYPLFVLLVWLGIAAAERRRGRPRLGKAYHLTMCITMALVLTLTVTGWTKGRHTVQRAEIGEWLSLYDPYRAPDPGRKAFSYERIGSFSGALSAQRASGESPEVGLAAAGAKEYLQRDQFSELREHWVSVGLREGLLSLEDVDQEEIIRAAEQLMADLSKERNRYLGVIMPAWNLERVRLKLQLTVGSGLLPLEDQELMAEKLLAGLAWEVRGEGPEEWLERKGDSRPVTISLTSVRAAVDGLTHLDAKSALEESRELVMEALQNNYRPTDTSGEAGFLLYAALGEDLSAEGLVRVNESDADALYLMELFGFPDFVDVRALHKRFVNASTDYIFEDRYPEGCYDADAYLAAALRFRLEQLYPEL